MKNLIMIAVGGASGALCRYWLMNFINKDRLGLFPLATISVNVIGSFCIGIMYVLITEKVTLHPDWRNVAMVGFLAAFTTFSTFSLETITLLEQGQISHALVYVTSSLVICVLASWLGITQTRLW